MERSILSEIEKNEMELHRLANDYNKRVEELGKEEYARKKKIEEIMGMLSDMDLKDIGIDIELNRLEEDDDYRRSVLLELASLYKGLQEEKILEYREALR